MHIQEFAHAVGREDLTRDPRFTDIGTMRIHKKEVESILSEIFLTKTTEEWLKILIKAGVPCGPVNTLAQGLNDPQVLHRNMVVTLEHSSGEKVKVAGNPIKMSGTPKEQAKKFLYPPIPGEHTEQVLNKLLGYSHERIQELRKGQVI